MSSIPLDELKVGKHYLFEKNVDNFGMKYRLKWRVILLEITKNDDGTYKITIVGETMQEMMKGKPIWYDIGILTFPKVNLGDYIIKEWTEKNKLFDSIHTILKGKLTDDNLTEINNLLIGSHKGPIGGKSRRRRKNKSNKRKSNKRR